MAAAALLEGMQKIVRGKLSMTTTPGGKTIVYASSAGAAVSVRRARQLAAANGKVASFVTAQPPHVIFTDAADEDDDAAGGGPPAATDPVHGAGDYAIRLAAQPAKIRKLTPKAAGSTDVYILEIPGGTLTAQAAGEWLGRAKSLDIHVGGTALAGSTTFLVRLLDKPPLRAGLDYGSAARRGPRAVAGKCRPARRRHRRRGSITAAVAVGQGRQ